MYSDNRYGIYRCSEDEERLVGIVDCGDVAKVLRNCNPELVKVKNLHFTEFLAYFGLDHQSLWSRENE